MPDLGQYATEVLSAYGISITVLLALVWQSIWRARKVRDQLEKVERDGRD